MALIPYQVIPDLRDPALVPSGGLTGHTLVESYCGDARCDCAVATLILDGYPLLVDLGTGRVDVTGTQRPLPPHQAAQRLLREALRAQADLLPRLRAHYAAAREYGLREHYRFVDWTRRPPRDPVLFEEILRTDGGHPWVLTLNDGAQVEAKQATVLLHDGFCVDRGCDCHKATFVVGLQTGGPPRRLGSVEVNLRTGEPKVLQAEPNMEQIVSGLSLSPVQKSQADMLLSAGRQPMPEERRLLVRRTNFAALASTLHEIVTRRYLQLGTIALVLMLPLAITSTDAMVSRRTSAGGS